MPKKSFSKYRAKKVTVDGLQFDSRKESERYLALKCRERKGEIFDLQLQVPFLLIPAQYSEELIYMPKRHQEKIVKKLIEQKVYILQISYILKMVMLSWKM